MSQDHRLTPEQRQKFIREHVRSYTDALNDRRDTLLKFADHTKQHGDTPEIIDLIACAAVEYAGAFWKLKAAQHEATVLADRAAGF